MIRKLSFFFRKAEVTTSYFLFLYFLIWCFVYFIFLLFFFSLIAPTTPTPPTDPCQPSPCGPYSQCRSVGTTPACSCLTNYIGQPPNCRPECIRNGECASNLACQKERCVDPCPGSCGYLAQCKVVNHNAICTCPQGYVGDATTSCQPAPVASKLSAKPVKQ